MEIFDPHSNIDFLRWGKVSVTISVLLIIVCALKGEPPRWRR